MSTTITEPNSTNTDDEAVAGGPDTAVDDSSLAGHAAGDAASTAAKRSRLAAIRGARLGIGRLIVGVVMIALIATVGVLGYMLSERNDTIDSMTSDAAGSARAEKVALEYATGAAQMDFNDLGAWNKRLTAKTSPELTKKLTDASSAMEQVILPLQWKSTASPIAAQIKSHNGSAYVVTAFVSVMTKNAQAPDGVQSTASYTVTLDGSKDWLITDVGGLDSAVAPK
jgi:Mce-associated membrane protein